MQVLFPPNRIRIFDVERVKFNDNAKGSLVDQWSASLKHNWPSVGELEDGLPRHEDSVGAALIGVTTIIYHPISYDRHGEHMDIVEELPNNTNPNTGRETLSNTRSDASPNQDPIPHKGSVGANRAQPKLSTHDNDATNTEKKESHSNQRQTRNSGGINSKDNPDSVGAKAINIVINKQPVNRDVPDHSTVEKSDQNNLRILDDAPEATRKRQIPLEDHPDEPRRKATRIFLSVEEDTRCTKDTPIHTIRNPVPIPTSYLSAVNDPIYGTKWLKAIKRELNELTANDTFEIIKMLIGVNLITVRWVYSVKYTINQLVEKYKARLVARGFL